MASTPPKTISAADYRSAKSAQGSDAAGAASIKAIESDAGNPASALRKTTAEGKPNADKSDCAPSNDGARADGSTARAAAAKAPSSPKLGDATFLPSSMDIDDADLACPKGDDEEKAPVPLHVTHAEDEECLVDYDSDHEMPSEEGEVRVRGKSIDSDDYPWNTSPVDPDSKRMTPPSTPSARDQIELEITNSSDAIEELGILRRQAAQAPQQYPWDLPAGTLMRLQGYKSPKYPIGLFDIREIKVSSYVSEHVGLAMRRPYYQGLFLQHRFFEGRNKRPKRGSEADALTQAWNAFVKNYSASPHEWMVRLEAAREKHRQHSLTGKLVHLHQLSKQHMLPCCVPDDMGCPCCLGDAPRMDGTAFIDWEGPWARLIPSDVRDYHAHVMTFVETHGSGRGHTTSDHARSRGRGQAHPQGGSADFPRYLPMEDTQSIGYDSGVSDVRWRQAGPRDRGSGRQASVGPPLSLSTEEVAVGGVAPDALHSRLKAAEARAGASESRCQALEDGLGELREDYQMLREEHLQLVADYKRLLGQLRAYGVPNVGKKRPSGDTDGGAQRKK